MAGKHVAQVYSTSPWFEWKHDTIYSIQLEKNENDDSTSTDLHRAFMIEWVICVYDWWLRLSVWDKQIDPVLRRCCTDGWRVSVFVGTVCSFYTS